MNYTIDATNKPLGRLATEVSTILLGKNEVTFARNTNSDNSVTVINASKIKRDPRKMLNKKYKTFSGYPGGLRLETMAHATETKGFAFVVQNAVRGMLPSNRLRKDMLKNLTITE